ncbi:MAG: glycoside hydrolase family 9 protein [Candidatus Azobacteroides sp.]|nr:glycoside hydrolase family 9 protein [Candidatus Azobacteroides sp.]
MIKHLNKLSFICWINLTGSLFLFSCHDRHASSQLLNLCLNDSGYFEARGLNIFVFSNGYDGLFDDAKISGIEMIHHGVRTATNGDVRLNPTPGQWDAIPEFLERKVDSTNHCIEAALKYAQYDFQYRIRGEVREGDFYLSVYTDQPIPEALKGIAGLNLEFLPSAYFGKSYIADETTGVFPLYPSSDMQTIQGEIEPFPLASGKQIILAPDDPERNISIRSLDNELMLFDGRNKAQNGWFVIRSLLPAGKSGKIAEWLITAQTIPNWTRRPVIAHSQAGYHPEQQKIAMIELDKNDKPLSSIQLQKVNSDRSFATVLQGKTKEWGRYLRYHYLSFDFSDQKDPGIYRLKYGDVTTAPFRIAADVYQNAWHPTLDIFLPVQMDHVFVREAYRVWHGASHLDDALQAPVNHAHFDLYAQGPVTGNRFKPLEHIPGLNVGGWYDAGDFDIRTQTQQSVVLDLVRSWEYFDLNRDETTIQQKNRYVEIHLPDGKPDILQQIEHGALQLLAQQKAVGYAVNGIIAAHIGQYRHLGDGANKTDNLVYNSRLDSLQSDGRSSGTFDDRWAFTNRSTPLNYGSAAALAAASRALKTYDESLAADCLLTAQKIWKEEHSHEPDIFVYQRLNTIGGPLDMEEMRAAIELLRTTGGAEYKNRILEMYSEAEKHFERFASLIAQAIPLMDASFKQQVEPAVKAYIEQMDSLEQKNPFGVFIFDGGWAGNGRIVQRAITAYLLYQSFPELVNKESVYKGLNYIFGCHPDSDISFVSAVGTESKRVAYGNNRADFTFIAGGVVPGILILKPDFPENKEDWPFFWGENEYVTNLAASYIFLVNAVNDLLLSSKNKIKIIT